MASQVFGGSGLGLHISRILTEVLFLCLDSWALTCTIRLTPSLLVQLMGGRIEVESVLGEGSSESKTCIPEQRSASDLNDLVYLQSSGSLSRSPLVKSTAIWPRTGRRTCRSSPRLCTSSSSRTTLSTRRCYADSSQRLSLRTKVRLLLLLLLFHCACKCALILRQVF